VIFDGETLCEEHYALKHIGVDSEVLNYCAICHEYVPITNCKVGLTLCQNPD